MRTRLMAAFHNDRENEVLAIDDIVTGMRRVIDELKAHTNVDPLEVERHRRPPRSTFKPRPLAPHTVDEELSSPKWPGRMRSSSPRQTHTLGRAKLNLQKIVVMK